MEPRGIKGILFVVFVLSLAVFTMGFINPATEKSFTTGFTNSAAEKSEDAGEKVVSVCPKTRMKTRCISCHTVPDFKVKESNPHAVYDYPTSLNFRFVFGEDGKPVKGHYIVEFVRANELQNVMLYCEKHGVNYLVVELFTPGGGLAEAYKIVGLMREWTNSGHVVETRAYGLAASAGFLIFASGTHGCRFVSPQAELMWHELQSLEGFRVATPSSKEDEAKIFRHLQDTAHNWLASVSNMTKDELDAAVRHNEFWITGVEAVEYGFADALIGVSYP